MHSFKKWEIEKSTNHKTNKHAMKSMKMKNFERKTSASLDLHNGESTMEGTVTYSMGESGESGSLTRSRNTLSIGGTARSHIRGNGCLQRTCLHPGLSLKYQLFLAFEIVSILSIAFAVTAGILVSTQGGETVKEVSRNTIQEWSQDKFLISARVIGETTTKSLGYKEGISAILRETTRDRFVGYPDHPGYANDLLVPFLDSISGNNVYPLKAAELLPFQWTATATATTTETVTETTNNELNQLFGSALRASWYNYEVSMTLPTFHMQGECTHTETVNNDLFSDEPTTLSFPQCVNTDSVIAAGGLAATTTTFRDIHSKASDYAPPILKSLYEIHDDAKSIGIYFANSGAGASVVYPGRKTTAGSGTYVSNGCRWMVGDNPIDMALGPIGTPEMMDHCHPEGTTVPYSDYNPLEMDWCRKQALDPDRYHFRGPYREQWTGQDEGQWLLGIGRAIYDRITNEFIACTLAEFPLSSFAEIITKFHVTASSEIALLLWDEKGTVITSEHWDPIASNTTTTCDDDKLGLGVTTELYGIMKQRFEMAYTKDYNRNTFERTLHVGERVISSYPVPVPPDEYDPLYRPEFMIVMSVASEEIFNEVDEVSDAVDESVQFLISIILIAGIAGLVSVTLTILGVSLYLTKPFDWMNEVGDEIMNSIGSTTKNVSQESSLWMRYSPRTEILSLVQRFQKMVKKFAGDGTAKLQFQKPAEVKNPFMLEDNFRPLYEKHCASKVKYCESVPSPLAEIFTSMQSMSKYGESSGRTHWGPNARVVDFNMSFDLTAPDLSSNMKKKSIFRSPLFWWIFSLITLPLLIAMVSISAYVTWNLGIVFPDLAQKVEGVFVNFEERSLLPLAAARADYATTLVATSVRDQHVLGRFTGWVMFGGLQKANSFTEISTGIEQCKTYSDDRGKPLSSCPYFSKFNTPCDCKWPTANKRQTTQCFDYDEDPRSHQKVWWIGSKLDAWENGDVNSTSFPAVANSPETTEWWNNQLEVPGFKEGLNATGVDTTYKLLHAISVSAIVKIPIVRYQGERRGDTRGVFTALEPNGILAGYLGCHQAHATFSHFMSNDITGAYRVNPTICPKGKFGYDPRCSGWYAAGKKAILDGGNTYLTPPFLFPQTGRIHQMFDFPLIDPKTGQFVGMTVIDFNGETIIDALSQAKTPLPSGGIHVVASVERDAFGSDTVVAPGFSFELLKTERSAPLEKFVQPYDFQRCNDGESDGCTHIRQFTFDVLEKMRAGNQGTASFTRANQNGESENIIWAYAPVKVRSLKPVDHSNFNAGVEAHETTVFSIALAHSEISLLATFDDAEAEIQNMVTRAIVIFVVCISLAFIAVMFITIRVTSSIIRPVAELLTLVSSINDESQEAWYDEISEIRGGSKEVRQVHRTFERLHSVMRFANSSFFSGELTTAHDTLQRALRVFAKLENQKAISVAHNNLGNIMLTMYRTMKETGTTKIAGLTKKDVIENGIGYFKKAIDAGEVAIEHINQTEGFSNNYLIFMQQLSNRYFNRAMFLLTVKEDHPNPDDARWQGSLDLTTTKDMDCEVVNNGDRQGFKGDDHVHFELMLTRIRGLLNLLDLGYEDDWDIEELFDEARAALNGALKQGPSNSTMFVEMEPAGQMQRLDAELIRYYTRNCKKEDAAMVAIRMLKEDEYVIGEAGALAIKALIEYLPEAQALAEDQSDISSALFQYRRFITDSLSTHHPFPHDTLGDMASAKSSAIRMIQNQCVKQSNIGDLSMELF